MYVPILTLICCLIRNYAHYYFCSGQTKISTPEGAVRMEVKKKSIDNLGNVSLTRKGY